MVFALGALPLATVNAIFYTAPLLMLPLAMILFQEKLTSHSIAAAVLGFIGVLIVVKPTQINWAAIAALVVALTMAVNNLLVRKLPQHHNVFQTLMLTNLVGIPAALGLALWEGGSARKGHAVCIGLRGFDLTPHFFLRGNAACQCLGTGR